MKLDVNLTAPLVVWKRVFIAFFFLFVFFFFSFNTKISAKVYLFFSPMQIYSHALPLPHGVQVIHASPAAGHLSSASIYPACYAPYVLVTACTDNTVRFWRCRMTGEGDATQIQWEEWRMVSKDGKSAIKVPGELTSFSYFFNIFSFYCGYYDTLEFC